MLFLLKVQRKEALAEKSTVTEFVSKLLLVLADW